MKTLLLSSFALMALFTAANAADLPVKAPPMRAAPAMKLDGFLHWWSHRGCVARR